MVGWRPVMGAVRALKSVSTKQIFAEIEKLKPEKIVVGISEKYGQEDSCFCKQS